MKNSIIYIVLVLATWNSILAQTNGKVILDKGSAYYMNVTGGEPVLTIVNIKSQLKRQYKVPVEVNKVGPMVYDIYGKYIYSMSISEFTPLQFSFSLVKSELDHLTKFSEKDTLKKKNSKFHDAETITEIIKVPFLKSVYLQSQIRGKSSISYDFVVLPDEKIRVMALINEKMISWEYVNKEWKNPDTVKTEFSENFFSFSFDSSQFYLTVNGVYHRKKGIKKIMEYKMEKDDIFLIEKEKGGVSIIEGYGLKSMMWSELYHDRKKILVHGSSVK